MHEDDDDAVTALPVDELRRRVYAKGADAGDERWIRAAAELTRRERASRSAEPADAGADADGDADTGSGAAVGGRAGSVGAADPDPTPEDGADPDEPDGSPAPRRGSRVVVAWSAAALALGLLGGAAIAGSLGTGSPIPTSADGSPGPGADAPPDAAASRPAASPSADGPALLGPDSTSDQRSRPVAAIFDGPQEDADRPPKAVRAGVDATTIRAVRSSVGLYAGLSDRGDRCLLVFPSGGAGVVTCASPERVASDGLRVAWTTEFPSRNRDGSTGMITGDVEAVWSSDDLITLTTPDRILAY
ncbi:hypothetical protein [Clavibacter michiganensis]|uniref:Uncharacterized protein n=1 Tax=Clavibacter michiganensis TaxID=28447 RepID=A0A251YVJ2_9MICO|nr:hypothetical protein [Clavibacter michiganensis]OUE28241.1 hypothetical protein BFL37_00075 [Clavibacter michiganensis]